MKTILFFFSGTGNTLAIARKLQTYLGNTSIKPIKDIKQPLLGTFDRIGILLPIYGTHAPRFVLEQLDGLVFEPYQKLFLLATYAGSRGYAVQEVKEILGNQSDISIQEFCVRMPGSYLLEYGAFPDWLQKRLFKRSELMLNKIVKMIHDDCMTEEIKPNLLSTIFRKNGIKMVESYSEKGRQFYVNPSCVGCKKCEVICPTGNIQFLDGKITFKDHCSQCMACIQWCPKGAISYPGLKRDRKKYHHPEISLQNLMKQYIGNTDSMDEIVLDNS